MRLHNRRADLQSPLAPSPIASTWAARERKYFPESFRIRGQRRLKCRREVRLGLIQFPVEHDVEIQRQIRARVAATAVDSCQFIKTNSIRVAAGRVKQHGKILIGNAGKPEQFGDVQLPTRALVGGQRFYMAGDQSVRSAQSKRFNPFVTDICSGLGFLIDYEGHSFASGLPPDL